MITSEKLRVASPGPRNMQQMPSASATSRATDEQRPSLKALAYKALARNNACNDRTTTARRTAQQVAGKTGPKVAQRLPPTAATTHRRLASLAAASGRDPALADRIPTADLPHYAGMNDAQLSALLSMLADGADRERGVVPQGDTAAILCRSCGPVWVHPAIARVSPVVNGWPRALGCPWCFIRALGIPFPQPRAPVTDHDLEACAEHQRGGS